MPEQQNFPEKWACQSEHKSVVVQVRVPETEAGETTSLGIGRPEQVVSGYSWIEIPTQSVEMWIEKGNSAAIQRTSKVRFPTEWGRNSADVAHNSPRRLLERFDPSDAQPFLHARIWMQDTQTDEWVLEHYGWIGGLGASSDGGISKLWVYDFAELIKGVPIGATFSASSTETILEQITQLTNGNTPAPVAETILILPDTEGEFQVTQSTQFGVTTEEGGGFSTEQDTDTIVSQSPYSELPRSLQDDEGDTRVTVTAPEHISGASATGMESKSFQANRDTLLDVWKWFEEKTGSKLHFEPLANGVALVADVIPDRRTFAAYEVIGDEGDDYSYYYPIEVTSNDALYELKPMNTMYLKGSYPQGIADAVWDGFSDTLGVIPGNGGAAAEEYPSVKVQSPALLDAAEGVELSDAVVESDATTLDDAKEEAKKKFSEKLSQTSEGEINTLGSARIVPYDAIDAYEVCGDHVEYEQERVTYEVESVKHEIVASDVFRTSLRVGIWANEENIEVVEAEMVAVEN